MYSLVFLKLGVCALVLVDNSVCNLVEERLLDAQKSAVTCCTSEQSAENVSSACVGSGNAIAYHECGASDVVGDNTEGNVGLFIFLIIYACNAADVLHYVLNGIYLEEVVNALHSAGKTLKAHTCINVLVSHFSVVAVSVAVELGEYQVPYLDNSVAVACLLKALKGAVFLASVEVDLRSRGRRGRSRCSQKLSVLAKTDNVSPWVNADVVHPDAHQASSSLSKMVIHSLSAGIASTPVRNSQAHAIASFLK